MNSDRFEIQTGCRAAPFSCNGSRLARPRRQEAAWQIGAQFQGVVSAGVRGQNLLLAKARPEPDFK
jgi:hypothetical protein